MALRVCNPAGQRLGKAYPLPLADDDASCLSRKSNIVRCESGAEAWNGHVKESRRTRKRVPFTPPAEDLIRQLERELAVLDLERILKVNLVPAPMKPDVAGPSIRGKPLKVAYQGMRGSYCQEAAIRAHSACDAVPFEGMESAFEAVESKAVDRAIVPVENSLDGSIERNYDLLLRHPLYIVGELFLPVNHCLLGMPGTKKKTLKRVISHPQALSHCHRRLLDLDVDVEAVDNAASAALFVAENGLCDTGVIGSCVAAKEFGLEIIEGGMQDDCTNMTRFLTLSRSSSVITPCHRGEKAWKTSVAFSLEEGTSDLFKALSIFALRDIKVAKIESRPQRTNPIRVVDRQNVGRFQYFEYIFVVDLQVEASIAHPEVVIGKALDQLRQFSSFVRLLGTYPIYRAT